MPPELMALAKDQFGPHYIQFEIWVGHVIDVAFNLGKAAQQALHTDSERVRRGARSTELQRKHIK